MKTPWKAFAFLILLITALTACTSAPPADPAAAPTDEVEDPTAAPEQQEEGGEAVPEETPTESTNAPETTEGMTAAVEVQDQALTEGSVVVPRAVANGPAWVVIHADQDGKPGPVIGQTAVEAGENLAVQVEIEDAAATPTLYAMLHSDTGEIGSYEFPDADPPVAVDGQVVVKPFQVEMERESSAESVMVEVIDSAFEPEEITIAPGTTVVWEQTGSLPHTVTADDGSFDSGDMSQGDSFSYTFKEEGTYPYYCVYHGGPGGQGMAGVIIVGGGGEGAEMDQADPDDAGSGEDETDSLY